MFDFVGAFALIVILSREVKRNVVDARAFYKSVFVSKYISLRDRTLSTFVKV